MRYEGPTDFEGIILWWATTRGPMAAPGPYRVKVTADGTTQTRDFEIVKNPNSKATDADLQEQFRLALRTRDRFNQCNDTVLFIRDLKDQIRDRTEKAGDETVDPSGRGSFRQVDGRRR